MTIRRMWRGRWRRYSYRTYPNAGAISSASTTFDLTIKDREFLVLLGPSGCGKTTTMRMVAGLEDVTEGQIKIGDRVVNDLDPKDRDVAMVFQSYGLYPNMNVYENIRFPLKVRKVDPQEQHDERVMRAAEMVELTRFLCTVKPAELSGGQRQRVALARAIVREPTVFLMDEPLSNLDAKLRVSTRAQIKNLQHELKVTTIYVTHDQIEAMTLADRVVVMNRGVVQQVGTPTDIYDNPANTFVASFIGSPAMNLHGGHGWRAAPSAGDNVRIAGLVRPRRPGHPRFSGRRRRCHCDLRQRGPDHRPGLHHLELLGDATMVTVRAGGAMVVGQGAKDYRTEIGDQVGSPSIPAICHLVQCSETGARLNAA